MVIFKSYVTNYQRVYSDILSDKCCFFTATRGSSGPWLFLRLRIKRITSETLVITLGEARPQDLRFLEKCRGGPGDPHDDRFHWIFGL